MRISDWSSDVCSADLGLIEGAAEGAGIGARFLGHIERCRVLLHLVDATGDDPVTAWKIVQNELAASGAGLEEKPQLLALNKGDLIDAELMADIAAHRREAGAEALYSLSRAQGAGTPQLLGYAIPRPGADGRQIATDQGEERTWVPVR